MESTGKKEENQSFARQYTQKKIDVQANGVVCIHFSLSLLKIRIRLVRYKCTYISIGKSCAL